jgi:hypothetical protein
MVGKHWRNEMSSGNFVIWKFIVLSFLCGRRELIQNGRDKLSNAFFVFLSRFSIGFGLSIRLDNEQREKVNVNSMQGRFFGVRILS